MLVLAIFAVGSVSAADDIADDIDVQTDDVSIDDVSVEEDSQTDYVNNRDSSDVNIYNTMTLTDIQDNIDSASSGSTVIFNPGTYTGIALNLTKDNVVYRGVNATLIGTGSSHVFNLVNNLNNFTISGFEINVNGRYSAIYGSFIFNGTIKENTLYNGTDGININRFYDNMTVEDNFIHDMYRDGISFAHPNANSISVNNLGNTYISRNNITNCNYSIFVGGNFRGVISNNKILNSTCGIQSVGKKDGFISDIVANISGNNISGVETGIEFINMTAVSLNITSNNIQTTNYVSGYTVDYGENFSNATSESINFYHNVLVGAIKQSLIDMTYTFDNWFDGYIIP